MARTFSSMDSLSLSYLRKTERKAGMACLAMSSRPPTRTGTTTTKVRASLPPMMKAMMMANRNISGARTAVRMIIMKAICTFVTSVVMRVTREAEEKRSMFSKAKLCTRTYMSSLRLRAKPVEASEQVRAAIAPHRSDSTAISASFPPRAVTSESGAPALIMLTMSAV